MLLLPFVLRTLGPVCCTARSVLPIRQHLYSSLSLAPTSAPAVSPAAAVQEDDSRPRLLAPVRHLLSDAVRRGYAKSNSLGLARATSNPKFVAAPDAAIVLHYSAIIRSIVNYYSFVHSRSSLWKVTSIYRKSCALTLARKHSLRSAQAAYSKFGPHLRIATPDSDDEAVVLFYPESLKTSAKFNVHSPRYSQVAILQEPFEKREGGNSLKVTWQSCCADGVGRFSSQQAVEIRRSNRKGSKPLRISSGVSAASPPVCSGTILNIIKYNPD